VAYKNVSLLTKLFILAGVFFIITSCADNASVHQLTKEQKSVISYFKEVCLGAGFGNISDVTRKWRNNMKIYVSGHPDKDLKKELNSIVKELNQLTSISDFTISFIADSTSSNAYLFFGAGKEFAEMVPSAKPYIHGNYGLFFVKFNSAQEITNANIYVDIFRAKNQKERNHLLREELTQSLGCMKDSPRYTNSIFQSSYQTKVTEYAKIDKQVIRLLYNPKMKTGLNTEQATKVLHTIITDVIPDS
jgi:hypothetical protein